MPRDYCTSDMPRPSFDCGGSIAEIRIPQPSRLIDPNKIKEIKISQLDHGYILNVGCKVIALDSPAKIIFALKLYLSNPQKVESEFLDGKFKFEK